MTINYSIIYPFPIYNQGLIKILDLHPDINFKCLGSTSSVREALIKISDWMGDVTVGVQSKDAILRKVQSL